MFVSIYYKPSLFNAHTLILIVHIFMNVNKLCLNQLLEKQLIGQFVLPAGRGVYRQTTDTDKFLPEI